MNCLPELQRRGMVAQLTKPDELARLLSSGPQSIYVGFDPTASSLHVGHLLPVMALGHMQRHGHRPIVLLGGATGMIGDPSGRSSERVLLTLEKVRGNARSIRQQLERFLRFEGEDAALMVNNHDWIGEISHLQWLRDVGKHFTVNYMLGKDSVRSRLSDSTSGLSYTEFSYMLLQAYDFLHLATHQGCRIQGGGDDQWGNITAGIELVRRVRGERVFGITFPLLTTASGEKFGKSAGNAVWLDPSLTSPYRFYQYWLNTDDRDVERLLKLFTFAPLDELEDVVATHAQSPGRRRAQRRLAGEVTRLIHGEEARDRAERASLALFGGDLTTLDRNELRDVFGEAPTATLDRDRLAGGLDAVTLLALTETTSSKGEARRLISSGGAYLNNQRIQEGQTINEEQLLHGEMLILRTGKKNYRLVDVR
ncbi:MAG TPA: tyrosine--tRNA ligase [Rhodothermales bacterium]